MRRFELGYAAVLADIVVFLVVTGFWIQLLAAVATWQFSPSATVPLVMLAAGYVTAARPCGQRRARVSRTRAWPGLRTLAFLGGLAVIAVAAQSWVAVHDDTLLTAHMVQHLLLIMVAPPLRVLGRPVTLLLHTVRNPWHTRVKRVVRSPVLMALTWPPAGVALYSAMVLGTHLTGLLTAHGAVHDAEHVAYLVAGYLYFLPVIGSEPTRWRQSALGRYLLLLAAMPADMATGAVLMVHGPLGPYSGGDVQAAGVIMLAGSDFIMTALAVALTVGIVTERADVGYRTAAAFRPAGLAAYNARLAALDTRGAASAPASRGKECRGQAERT